MKYYDKITGYGVDEKELKLTHPNDYAQYIRDNLNTGRYEKIYKIGSTELTETECSAIRDGGKYIVNYSGVYQIEYSQAQRRYYGMKVYNNKGMTRRGRYHVMSGEEVNQLIGFELLR